MKSAYSIVCRIPAMKDIITNYCHLYILYDANSTNEGCRRNDRNQGKLQYEP